MADTTYAYLAPQSDAPGGGQSFVLRDGNTFIPCNLANNDYQGFLTWMAEGNAAPQGWTGPTNASG